MDTYGGISVSEVVARHSGEHPLPNVQPPRPARPPRPAQPPQPSGEAPVPPRQRRPAPRPPADPPTQRRTPPDRRAPQDPPTRKAVPPDAGRPRPRRTAPPAARRPSAPGGAQSSDRLPRPDRQPPPGRAPRPTPAPPSATPPQGPPQAEAASAAEATRQVPRKPQPSRPLRRPAAERPPVDRLTMTDQMEPVDEATMYRRKIDDSLARFSAAHDDAAAEEERRKQRRERFAARPAQLLEQTRTKLQRVVTSSDDERTRFTPPAQPPDAADEAVENASTAPKTRLQEKKQRRSDRSILVGRIAAAVVAGLVFLATGAAWGTKTWFNAQFKEISALDEDSKDIQNGAGQIGDENFLIVGSDSRADAAAEDGVGNANGIPGARSDTVMLAHIPADRQRAVVVSFPRDLEVTRPECKRFNGETNQYTDQTAPQAKQVKLNTVYGLGGPACLTKWIQQLSGMKVNHFIGIDFNGFKGMVDAVHGVPVHLDRPIKDTTLGNIFPEAGDLNLTGDQALNYVRARHVTWDPTSDYGRIKRQQTFIGSLLKKTMSRDVLLDPGQLSGFVTAFANATFGDNIGIDQLMTLAQSMKGLDPAKVNFLTVPTVGEGANSRGNEDLIPSKAKALFEALIANGPLPSDKAAGSGSATPGQAGSSQGTTGHAKPES
ncbi:Transcriptional regulator LytR [Amycolatopsis sp. CA-230715]|nr:Transcriptional regulator LytR [Amycolatopsis sp. CA-230715]